MVSLAVFVNDINVVSMQLPADDLAVNHVLATPQGDDIHLVFP